MGRVFLQHLFTDAATLGEAVAAAKAQGDSNYRGSWILFGDPTLQLVIGRPVYEAKNPAAAAAAIAAELADARGIRSG